MGAKTKSKYPHEYRNKEKFFEPREAKGDLVEYPLQQAGERFYYHKKNCTLKKAQEPIPKKGRASFFHRTPKNDPGSIRGIVDHEINLIKA